ncbi:MAG: thiamine diphosphokinase [Dehalococcoidia bacterium]|nr:thiamine diphosphokinase [Dehalococcoidia bacterium]
MKALIVANGELFQPEILKRRIAAGNFELVVGADGGALKARALGISVNAVVGDMDSMTRQARLDFTGAEFVTHPAEKNETDLELALDYAAGRGAETIVIVGAAGGRLDSTVANLRLLAGKYGTASRIELWHGAQTAWVIHPPTEDIHGRIGDTLSLIPFAGDVAGIVTTGLKYPLRSETLCFESGRGLSNVFTGETARVEFSTGLLLAVHMPQDDPAKDIPLNVSVQVLPLAADPLPIVDKALEVIRQSGVKYEVGPLETTLEGVDLGQLLEIAEAAHRACFEAGAERVVSIIKIAQDAAGTTIEGKTAKHRRGHP